MTIIIIYNLQSLFFLKRDIFVHYTLLDLSQRYCFELHWLIIIIIELGELDNRPGFH